MYERYVIAELEIRLNLLRPAVATEDSCCTTKAISEGNIRSGMLP